MARLCTLYVSHLLVFACGEGELTCPVRRHHLRRTRRQENRRSQRDKLLQLHRHRLRRDLHHHDQAVRLRRLR